MLQIVVFRSLASLCLTAALVSYMRTADPNLQVLGIRSNTGRLLARGVSGAAAMTMFYFSIKLLPLGDATTVFFTNVILTSIASTCIGYEAPKWTTAIACALCSGVIKLVA